jgi:hypothetical protein
LDVSNILDGLIARNYHHQYLSSEWVASILGKMELLLKSARIESSDDIISYNSLLRLLSYIFMEDIYIMENVNLIVRIVGILIRFGVSSKLNSTCTEILRRNTELRWRIFRKFFSCSATLNLPLALESDDHESKENHPFLSSFLEFCLNELSESMHNYLGDILCCIYFLFQWMKLSESEMEDIISSCWRCYSYCTRKSEELTDAILKLCITSSKLWYIYFSSKIIVLYCIVLLFCYFCRNSAH